MASANWIASTTAATRTSHRGGHFLRIQSGRAHRPDHAPTGWSFGARRTIVAGLRRVHHRAVADRRSTMDAVRVVDQSPGSAVRDRHVAGTCCTARSPNAAFETPAARHRRHRQTRTVEGVRPSAYPTGGACPVGVRIRQRDPGRLRWLGQAYHLRIDGRAAGIRVVGVAQVLPAGQIRPGSPAAGPPSRAVPRPGVATGRGERRSAARPTSAAAEQPFQAARCSLFRICSVDICSSSVSGELAGQQCGHQADCRSRAYAVAANSADPAAPRPHLAAHRLHRPGSAGNACSAPPRSTVAGLGLYCSVAVCASAPAGSVRWPAVPSAGVGAGSARTGVAVSVSAAPTRNATRAFVTRASARLTS